jgi:acyl-coenzyme A thioesterase PaaI-like protein
MGPVAVGPMFVDGRVVHRGRDILFLEGVVKNKDNKLPATAAATARMYPWTTQRGLG